MKEIGKIKVNEHITKGRKLKRKLKRKLNG